MHPLVQRLSNLHGLAIFEAAARTGSFTAAAEELGITQSGVSRRIASLERSLRRPLFDRHPNRVEVNPAGAALLEAVRRGLNVIEDSLERLDTPATTFTLACNPGYAQQWIIPRLDDLQALLGDRDLRLRLFDRDQDLEGSVFDAAIHLVEKSLAPARSHLLFDEVTLPLASPTFAATRGLDQSTDPTDLLSEQLLSLDGEGRQWMTWTHGFGAAGHEWSSTNARVVYNNYAAVLDDAIAGRGVALAWSGLADGLIERGTLVVVGPRQHRADFGYLLLPGQGADDALLTAIADWARQATD